MTYRERPFSNRFKRTTAKFFILIFLSGCMLNKKPSQVLEEALTGFAHPQDSARTKVWWFHGETETTKSGITADLEAFKKAGVGGVVYYDQSHGNAENALKGFSPEWWKMLRFASTEAERIGLTFEIHLSNGYVAGGPWITDETAMKRLVATETILKGGKHFSGKLPEPENKYHFFRDVAVLAFPAQSGAGISSLSEPVKISSSLKDLDIEKIFGPNAGALTRIARNDSGVFINLEFQEEFEARSITYSMQPRGKATTSATNVPGPPAETFVGTGYKILPDFGQLEASEDGLHFRKVCDLKPIYRAHESWRQKTIAFAPVKAKFYRLNLHDWWEENESNQELMINAMVINGSAKLDQWEEKSGLFAEYIEKDKTPSYPKETTINSSEILNITEKMNANGMLEWDVPEGDWMVMRFAYEPTGASTKHGRANLMGRECDKLSVKAAEIQWNNYVARIADSLQKSGSGKLSGVAMDSHEAGAQNWTDDFIQEFTTRRGYDPTPYLPAMLGYVVNGVAVSDGFLFDVRRIIADMISENYYGTFERLSQARNLTFTAQAIGNALCIVGDPIQAKGRVSKPQGEFWAIHPDGNYDIKESSSAAHLYGKKIASAEAYTDAKYSTSLADLKSLADYAYAFGINEFVICASAYQPWLDKIPGSTGGGRHYAINRNNTWWDYSQPFWDFQARSSYVMRTGKSVADLCIYLGENAPVKILTYRLPEIPGGFDFDAFTTDALLNRMEAEENKIVLPDGVSYKMMVLPRNGHISLKALQKISSIVEKGGKIFGPKPSGSGSAKDLNEGAEYQKLADQLWGENPGLTGYRNFGKGSVYWGASLGDALIKAGIQPDVDMSEGNTKSAKIYFAHRKLKDADIYFLDNHKDSAESSVFTFSSARKYAQLWDATTGERFTLPIKERGRNTVSIPLFFEKRASYFVIITDKKEHLPLFPPKEAAKKVEAIAGPWKVYFDKKMGGPGGITMGTLKDWTTFSEPGIKYYSGTAIYSKTINIDPGNRRIEINLGNPGSAAQVLVNGKEAGIVWCSPWSLDITKYLKKGENHFEIKVANSLMNRMIYDAQLPEDQRITYAYPAIASPKDELVPSGLTKVELFISP